MKLEQDEDEDCEPNADPEIVKATKEVTEDEKQDEGAGDPWHHRFMPRQNRCTLSEALAGHESLEAATDDLWRLLFFLRSSPGACDVDILPKPMLSRQKVQLSGSKWHNLLLHRMSLMDAQTKEPAVRAARQTAWMQSVEKTRQRHAPMLPENLEIAQGDVVAVRLSNQWEAGLVLSVWRNMKNKSGGGQLCSQQLPRGSMSAIRVVRCFDYLVFSFASFSSEGVSHSNNQRNSAKTHRKS